MKKLTLVLAGNLNFAPYVLIDNKKIKFKKNRMGHRIYEIETDKEEVEIEIFKWFEIESKHWMFFSLFFFMISFFGLFDVNDDKLPYSLKYKGKIKINEEDNYLKIILNSFRPGERAFVWEGNCSIDYNDTNIYFIDNMVVERRKKIKKLKRIIRICGIALLSIILVLCI